jgi:hypothetical protein
LRIITGVIQNYKSKLKGTVFSGYCVHTMFLIQLESRDDVLYPVTRAALRFGDYAFRQQNKTERSSQRWSTTLSMISSITSSERLRPDSAKVATTILFT